LAHDTEEGALARGGFRTTAAPLGPTHPARYTPLAQAAAWLCWARANIPSATITTNATCFISIHLRIPQVRPSSWCRMRTIFGLVEIVYGDVAPGREYAHRNRFLRPPARTWQHCW